MVMLGGIWHRGCMKAVRGAVQGDQYIKISSIHVAYCTSRNELWIWVWVHVIVFILSRDKKEIEWMWTTLQWLIVPVVLQKSTNFWHYICLALLEWNLESNCAILSCPKFTAICNGVFPHFLSASTFVPCSNRRQAVSSVDIPPFCCATQCNSVILSVLCAFTSKPCSSNNLLCHGRTFCAQCERGWEGPLRSLSGW